MLIDRFVRSTGIAAALSLPLLVGCNIETSSPNSPAPAAKSPTEGAIVLLNVTSDAQSGPQAVDMAMKLAGFSLDEKRSVVMFFNVKGVNVPSNKTEDAAAFQENEPLKKQLAKLIERGADVHVCPICMKALGVEESDLVEGASVTTRAKLFANIDTRTSVFTY